MINGEITAISNKNSGICFLAEGMATDQERWFSVAPDAFKFAKKGKSMIAMNEKNVVTMIQMILIPQVHQELAATSRPVGTAIDHQRLIVRQSCLKAAVEYIQKVE